MSKLPGECILEPVSHVSQNKPVRFAFHGQELRSNIRELGFRKISLHGIGPTKFDEMVSDGRMPRSKRVDGRVFWDRLRIEAASIDLPEDGKVSPLD